MQPLDIEKASKEIKIISEDIGEDPEFKEAHKLLEQARVIYFLGFGYNDTNLGRLKISKGNLEIRGTGYGLGSADIEDIKGKWANLHLNIYPIDVMGFLREYGSLK